MNCFDVQWRHTSWLLRVGVCVKVAAVYIKQQDLSVLYPKTLHIRWLRPLSERHHCTCLQPGVVLVMLPTSQVINLQGVELTKPALSMIVPQQLGAVNPAPGRTSPQLLLSIAMTVRLLNLPPMDMQF